jgi:hypothetical protein
MTSRGCLLMSNMRKFERALLAVALMMAGEGKTEPLSLVWTRQISTRLIDYAAGVSADGLGNVYITGEYGGPLPSPVPPIEAFTAKFDSIPLPTKADSTLPLTRWVISLSSEKPLAACSPRIPVALISS